MMITFSEAIKGYMLHAESRKLSQHTLDDYMVTFRKFGNFLDDDPPLAEIDHRQIEAFLAEWKHLKAKTLLNYHIGLSALWTWAIAEGIVSEHTPQRVKRPKPAEIVIEPFTESEVKLLLAGCDKSVRYQRNFDAEPTSYSLPTRLRNRAIVLTLLDTGVRASELCGLKVRDIDLKEKRVMVLAGKGAKQRIVRVSGQTGKAIWRYLVTRPDRQPDSALFSGQDGFETHLKRSSLNSMLDRLGQRAGVNNVHPHRFRHTFAISFLRNGGNIYFLQQMLGHSSLEMVKRYLAIAEQDIAQAHRLASPVANWNL